MKILGITHSCYCWNNAASLIINGRLIAFAEEERFIRKKHAPFIGASRAVEYCLKKGGLKMSDLDFIVVGFNNQACSIDQILELNNYKNKIKTPRIKSFKWNQPFDFYDPRKININHHIAHISSSFYLSGFNESNFISLDRKGESESGLLGYGEGVNLNILHRIKIQESWGCLYEDITQLLGFKKHSQEGKTMGLSGYGRPNFDYFNFINWKAKPIPRIDYEKKQKFLKKIKKRENFEKITRKHKNLAATVQFVLEKAALQMVKYLYQQTGSKNLCLSGGTALNCAMNGKLLSSKYVDNIYIQPASNDAGTALGAAVYLYVKKNNKRPSFDFNHAYWGPEFNNNNIKKAIKKNKVKKYRFSDNIFKKAAEKISHDKIIGWFQGKMEIGPRALGNRSILANPSSGMMRKRISCIKERELWRPFAPSILEEYSLNYVKNYHESPFMNLAFEIKKNKRKDLLAVVHIDNTIRLQTVSKKTNLLYWKLINEFRKITGIPALLNTSFNLANEPIVCSPEDAIKTFYDSDLDYLFIGDYLIEK